jgi:hypothetical protein
VDAYQQPIALQGKNLGVEDLDERHFERCTLGPVLLELDVDSIESSVPQMA